MESSRARAPSRAAFGLLELGLLLITPLAFYRGFPDQFTSIKLILTEGIVLLAAVGIVLGLVWKRRRRLTASPLAAPLALLTMAVLVSCLVSPLPTFSLLEAEYFLCGPLWLVVLISRAGGEARMRCLAGLVAVAGTAVAA